MAPQTGFWDRLQDEVRTGYERTRRTTKRAVRIGVLRVDLLSLRRDRSRAMAQLGERAWILWGNAVPLTTLEGDAEALRLRSLIEGIERCIVSKESELSTLREEDKSSGQSDAGGSQSPRTEETHGIS